MQNVCPMRLTLGAYGMRTKGRKAPSEAHTADQTAG